jgi:DNA-binding LytR/AlgR family response regulator
VATELKRISLKQFELQIADFPSFFRCHRAYLVNLAQIKNVSGNSQGYFLSFQDATEKVPVSRAQLASFNNLYKPLSAA